MSQNHYKQKLKEIHEKLKKWCEDNGDEELDGLLDELQAAFDAEGDGEGDSNPPGGPGTPP
jgi:hypothetical protein